MYLLTADMDVPLAAVRTHGETVLDGPQDSPSGRVTTVQDPAGASFQTSETPSQG